VTTLSPARTLLAHVVDYAGTFPPANLALDAAASTYAREHAGPDAWLLGRFVIGVQSLDAMNEKGAGGIVDPFALSVIAGPDARALAQVDAFNARWAGRARVASIEFLPAAPADVAGLMRLTDLTGSPVEAFFEVPLDADLHARLDAISSAGGAAKVRTGGTTPAAIPTPTALADFLYACAQRRLPFKATAGLHHAVRSCYALTYEPDSATAVMHGFLNVIAAAALSATGARPSDIAATLAESSAKALMQTALRHDPAATRRFFRSFGSCSFREPAEALAQILADLKVGTTAR
jgi:hypothetical protein